MNPSEPTHTASASAPAILSVREAGRTCLRITLPPSQDPSAYVLRMLKAPIPGLLPASPIHRDGTAYLDYDTTGLQPLSTLLRPSSLSDNDLRTLLSLLASSLSSVTGHLLPETNLLFDPRYIYRDWDETMLYLCFVPFDIAKNGIRALGEALLLSADEEDPAALMLALRLFRKTRSDSFTAADLLALTVSGRTVPDETLTDVSLPEASTRPSSDVPMTTPEADPASLFADLFTVAKDPPKKRPSRRRLFARSRKKTVKHDPSQDVLFEDLPLLPSASAPDASSVSTPPPKPASFPAVLEAPVSAPKHPPSSPAPPFAESSGGTVFLADDPDRDEPALWPDEGNTLPRIVLHKDTTRIGKLASACDVVIPQPTVSRLHAVIEREKDGLVIEDMSSRNGTSVNGKTLSPGERMRIKNGDKIVFAAVPYVLHC